MTTVYTSQVLKEVVAVISACPEVYFVDLAPIIPLDQETNRSSAYVDLDSEFLTLDKFRGDVAGYSRTLHIPITINVDCTDDKYKLYDVVNDVERCLLNDSLLWSVVTDRNIVSIEYDNSKYAPKRSAIILFEVIFRIACDNAN